MAEDKKEQKQVQEAVQAKPRKAEQKADVLYSQSQMADVLGVNVSTVNRYIRRNHIKGIKSPRGREILYHQNVLDKIKREQEERLSGANANKEKIIVQNRSKANQLTLTNVMKEQVLQYRQENDHLRKQLDLQAEQMQMQIKQIESQNKLIENFQSQNEALRELVKQNQELVKQNNELTQKRLEQEKERAEIEKEKLSSEKKPKHWWQR